MTEGLERQLKNENNLLSREVYDLNNEITRLKEMLNEAERIMVEAEHYISDYDASRWHRTVQAWRERLWYGDKVE